jgi:2-polyprenyl-6-methoxyphenol hydroxylase-like FAD-dependent oxidoreductase
VALRLGWVKVEEVDMEKTRLVSDGDEKVEADLIIAADGVHSFGRPSVIDSTKLFPYQAAEHHCFRFMVLKSMLQGDEIMASPVEETADIQLESDDKWILLYSIDFDRQYNVTYFPHPASRDLQMAIEDGITLPTLLLGDISADEIPNCVKRFGSRGRQE